VGQAFIRGTVRALQAKWRLVRKADSGATASSSGVTAVRKKIHGRAMRHWRLLLMAAVAAGFAIFIYARLPRAPFAFLEGYEPLPECDLLVYVFRADSEPLLRRAEEEFRRAGFSIHLDAHDGSEIKASREDIGIVDVFANSRIRPPGPLDNLTWWVSEQPGWISVVFWSQAPAPSMWERLKRAIGI
jgi:hypothetical protein